MGMLTISMIMSIALRTVAVSVALRITMSTSLRTTVGSSLRIMIASLSSLTLTASLRCTLTIGTLNNAGPQSSIELIARIAASALIGVGNSIAERIDPHTFFLQMIKIEPLVALGAKSIAAGFAVGIFAAWSGVCLINDALVVLEVVAVVA